MTTVYITGTGVFVRCGGPDKDKFQQSRRALQQTGAPLYVPQRVYEGLGGDPTVDAYPSGNIPYPDEFEEDWIVVADELDYTNPLVSIIMGKARRFVVNETGRGEDIIRKADTTPVEPVTQVFDIEQADHVVFLTTDGPNDE